MALLSFRARRRKSFLLQVGVRDDLLAAGDEIAEGLALEHAVRQQGEVGDLVQDLVPGREGLHIGPMGLADLLAGLAGGVLLRIGGIGRGLGRQLAQMHYAVGFGGRLALNKNEKLHARGDLSLVDGQHIGITIDLRESFELFWA